MENEFAMDNVEEHALTPEELKEEELLKTIKMEPILSTTSLYEEPTVTKQKKKFKIMDIFLGIMIALLVGVFGYILFRLF